ncbi:MAG: hypothetical protein ABW321_15130 [Polyangiales bacterium]
MRWFRGQLEGSYVGLPQVAAAGPARRFRLQVYRAALRELQWIEPVPEVQAPGVEPGTLWQAQIDHAHLAGVRGPGTFYEGPVFDVRIRSLVLTHPTEHGGRSYGRIVGEAVGWLELPPPPAAAPVQVVERSLAEAPRAEPLEGSVYTDVAATLSGAAGPGDDAGRVAGGSVAVDGDAEAAAEGGKGTRPTRRAPFANYALGVLLPLIALVLALASGALPAGLWVVLMLITLGARKLFGGVLRDSGFIRGCGYAAVVVQWLCSASLLPLLAGHCAQPTWWRALICVLLLFPSGLLPATAPLATSAVALALVLAGLTQRADPRCLRHAAPVEAQSERP